MSTRVVNDSMKKLEGGKSSKVVANTGYELVQHTKGRKSPSTSGYHVPDTRAVGGYELVKSPAGKRTNVTQNIDVYEKPMDKEIEKPKRDVVLVIAIMVVVVVTVVTVLSVTIAFFAVSDDKEPLPDLTELCRIDQIHHDGVDIDCYYHLQKYPTYGCAGTVCIGMGDQLQIDEHFEMTNVAISALGLTKIPNKTPCAPGKWCQEGVCVETKDSRVKQYDEMQPVDSYWVNTCERTRCILTKGKSKTRLESLIGQCIDESECNENPDVQKVAFGYRYCTIPHHGGTPCSGLPIHVIKNCGPCSSTVNNTNALHINENCDEDEGDDGQATRPQNGVPCKLRGSIGFGFCFLGYCVPDGSNDQQCLTKTNLTTY